MTTPPTLARRAALARALPRMTHQARPATARRARLSLAVCTAAVALAGGGLLAACGTTTPGAAPTRTVTVQASPSTGQATSPATSPATSSAPAKAAAAGPSTCLASGLQATLGISQGTAGTIYQVVVLTNTSASTCVLGGYPGVSFVTGMGGQQVGAAAARNPAVPTTLVTLVPGGQANMLIALHDAGAYPPSECQMTSVDWLKIYPPADYGSVYVQYQAQTCARAAEVIMSVTAMQAGAGSSA
jgi:Protein of unknown function (DUF4232)